MNIWWVNHKQTWKEEFEGGYIWSPKRKSNGSSNHFYDNLKKVRPGDIVFSYAYGAIQGLGIAKSTGLDAPKPDEFHGFNWDESGWMVNVKFQKLIKPLKIKSIYSLIASKFPTKYSPINTKGEGNQGCYLAQVSLELFEEIRKLIPLPFDEYSVFEEFDNVKSFEEQKEKWEDNVQQSISDSSLSSTQKEQVIKARKGQGKFRENVLNIERMCRITKVNKENFLIASHIKPWRRCESVEERLSGENGLMLTPTIDLFFDRGWLTFEKNGSLVFSDFIDEDTRNKLYLKQMNTGSYTDGQKSFLEFHNKEIFIG